MDIVYSTDQVQDKVYVHEGEQAGDTVPQTASIKAHPATPHLPRPYGNGFPRKDGEPQDILYCFALPNTVYSEITLFSRLLAQHVDFLMFSTQYIDLTLVVI